jgi:hypothetical protein
VLFFGLGGIHTNPLTRVRKGTLTLKQYETIPGNASEAEGLKTGKGPIIEGGFKIGKWIMEIGY